MAYHSCPGYSDVWCLCNSDFIFVMSTCRFFITPGRGAGSLAIPVSGLRRAAPQRPVAKQRWGMLSPCAQNLRVYWLANTNRRLPIGTGSRYIFAKRIFSIRKPQLNTDTWIGRKGVAFSMTSLLTHCGRVTPFDGIELGRYLLNGFLPDGTSHYLNQCWPVISKVQWHSLDTLDHQISL